MSIECFTTMYNPRTMTKEQYAGLVGRIFQKLRSARPCWRHNRLFINNEFDSCNHTKFERQSSKLKIGVLANSKRNGYILTAFLRMIVDGNHEYIRYLLEEDENQTEFDIEEVMNILANAESNSTDIYKIVDAQVRMLDNDGRLHIITDPYFVVIVTKQSTPLKMRYRLSDINAWQIADIKPIILNMLK
jgi:hypothetical protein